MVASTTRSGSFFLFAKASLTLWWKQPCSYAYCCPDNCLLVFKGGAPKAFGAHNRLLRSTTLICSGFCSNRSVKTSGFFWRQSFFR